MQPGDGVRERSALAAVGIDEDEERLYRWLLFNPTFDLADVCRTLDLTPARAGALLGSLEARGLLSRTGPGGDLVPEPPDLAIDRLILRRREELDRAHAEAAGLADRFRQPLPGTRPAAPVEVAVGPSAVSRHLAELAGAATEELLFLSPGGAGWPGPDDPTALEPRDRSVRRRVIYDRDALEGSRIRARLSGSTPDALEARWTGDVPVTLMVADRLAAVVSLPATPSSSLGGAALVRPSALLDALLALFDLLWSRAVPLLLPRGAPGGPLSAEDSRLLSLVLAGLTDQGMARQLGCSDRTVQRRIRTLMSRWGVSTRTQLVWRAAREGWPGDG